MSSSSRAGVWYAIGSYALWGTLPIYWKLLDRFPAEQLVLHRILWSFLLLLAILVPLGRWRAVRRAVRDGRTLLIYSTAAVLIAIGWIVYVWAVISDLIVETSLGYFITPLLNVFLAMIFLGERLRPLQWIPLALAAAGVIYLGYDYGSPPYVAIVLALSASFYALVKKRAPLGSLEGMMIETGVLAPLAMVALVWLQIGGHGVIGRANAFEYILLIGTGAATTLPLLMFASAARRIPLVQIGLIQYMSPTISFLIGVLLYDEPLSTGRLTGFIIVWIALALFAAESYRNRSAKRRSAGSAAPVMDGAVME